MRVGGIDEAGRGAVIGPLVVAGVFTEKTESGCLQEIGVKDSKLLSPQRREEIFYELQRRNIEFHFFEILPDTIDAFNINTLEIEATALLLRKGNPKRVLLDVPAFGRGIARYCARIKEKLGGGRIDIQGGNKFDSKHLIVGAASIVAKVMRDRRIEELKKIYGEFGSGYPNGRTVVFLQANFERVKPIVRMKWRTIRELRITK